MNLVQMRHPWFPKAYMRKFNTKMNGTTRIDEFAKKLVDFDGF